jgi:sugar lactone lactonase YvrE
MQGSGKSLLIVLMFVLLLPLRSFGAEAIRLKYGLSLYTEEKGTGLNQPEGIACGEDRLVVADTGNGRLIVYTLQGGDPTGGKEIKLAQVLYPQRVRISSKGDLFVLDGRLRKILRLGPDGAFKQNVEMGGLPTEGMVVPAGIDLDGNDNLYVLDILAGRVLVFGADGKFQRQINFPKSFGFFTDLAVDQKGTVFVVDSVDAVVYSNAKDPAVLSPFSGSLKNDLKFAGSIALDSDGTLFITDQNSGGVLVVGKDGTVRSRLLTLGWKEGTVRYPSQLCVDKAGDLFVADRANNRIQEFTPLK